MPSLKLLVAGATGGTGRLVVERALEAGFDLTVLARDPSRLPPVAQHSRVVRGDLLEDPGVLDEAVAGQHAVISAIGVGQSFKSRQLIARSAPAMVAAMSRHGVPRLIFMSAFGVGATRRDVPLVPRLFMATLLRDIYADKHAGEQAILSSDLDWTLVYPVGLTNAPPTGRYRVGERLPLSGFPHISRADVADCIVQQVQDPTYIRKGILVAP